MNDEIRFVLVKPGDVLLIGNMGELTEELPDVLHAFKEAVGVSHVAVFPGDISISTASSTDLEHPSTDEPGVVRHGTDDLYPYGGSYDEGRDYTITCYCGVEFTGETDGSVEASLDEHVDQMDRAGDMATDGEPVELQQPSTLGAMLDQLDLAPSLEADERIEQALVIATVSRNLPDGDVRYRTVALVPAAANRLGLGILLDFASDRARVIKALRHGR